MRTVRLLGEYLRERTALTDHQVVDGLRQQMIARDKGRTRRLGEILIERGYVTCPQVEEAAARQRAEERLDRSISARRLAPN
ncbi:MAG: hypothetical protein ACYC3S_06480 [Chloroflexota bacterium]